MFYRIPFFAFIAVVLVNSLFAQNTTSMRGGLRLINNRSVKNRPSALTPFSCSEIGYGLKNAATAAELWTIDIANGTSNVILSPIIPASSGTQGANSIGYNPLDNLIYAKRIGTNEIIQIGSNGEIQIIPVTGLATVNLFAADVSNSGIYYLTRSTYTTLERIDLDPLSPNYLTRLSPITVPAVNYSDIGINPIDNMAYAVSDGVAPHNLYRIDLSTGATTTIGAVTGGGSENVTSSFGAYWFDLQGNMYINHGASGNTFMIATTHLLTPGAVTSSFVSTSTLSLNDGARCNASALTLGPNLTVVKSHTGSFSAGGTGTYTITVTNTGESPTSGTITAVDSLPNFLSVNGGGAAAVTVTGANAANWSCSSNSTAPQQITCTSSTVIAATQSSTFNLTVNVSPSAPLGTNTLTNNVTVSGGGEVDTTNNSASDPTSVNAPTASGVTVSGKLKFGFGNGITKTPVMLINLTTGEELTTVCAKTGAYAFYDVDPTYIYIVKPVASKRASFTPAEIVIQPLSDVSSLNFVQFSFDGGYYLFRQNLMKGKEN